MDEKGSFTAAAKTCYVSQPALSKSVQEFEKVLGFPIFMRTPQGIIKTAQGSAFLQRVRKGFHQLLAAVEWVETARENRDFLLGTTPHVNPRLISTARSVFDEMAAKVKGKLEIYTAPSQELLAKVEACRLDAAFIHLPPADQPYFHKPQLQFVTVATERLAVALPPSHALAQRHGPVNWQELRRQPMVIISKNYAYLHNFIVSVCRRHGIEPELQSDAMHMPQAIDLVGAGIGFALIRECDRRGIGARRIRFRQLAGDPVQLETLMAYHRENRAPFLFALIAALSPGKHPSLFSSRNRCLNLSA